MTTKLKLWIVVPVSVFAALLLALVLLVLLVDPNDYRDRIEAIAESTANIDLQIKGDIGWSLFPWIGFDIHQIDVYTLEHPQKKEFIHLSSASAELKLWPLFSGNLEVGALSLSGLKLNLVKDERGRGNWESVVKKPELAEQQSASGSTSADRVRVDSDHHTELEGVEQSDFSVAIAKIQIQDAQLHFADQINDQKMEIELIELLATNINFNNTFPLRIAFAVKSHNPNLLLQAEVSSMMGISRGGYALYLKQLLVEGDISGEPFNDKQVPIEITGDISLDLKEDSFDLKSFALKLANMPLILKLQGENISTDPTYTGSVRVAEFNPREWIEAIGQQPPKFPDNRALTDLSMKANLEGSANQWVLKSLKLKMDDSTLIGNIGVSDLEAGALFWNLELDHLNVDDYLPDTREPEKASDADAVKNEPAEPLPLETIRRLELQGEIRAGAIEFSGIQISNLLLRTHAKDGQIRIDPLQAELYQGQLVVKANADARSELLKVEIESTLNGVEIQPLLASIIEVDLLEGQAQLNTNLNMKGRTVDQLIGSLTGPGRIEILNGKLKGTNLTEQLCKGVAMASNTTLPAYSWNPDTEFNQFGGAFQVNQGVFTTPDMAIDLQSIKVTGDGWINIPQSSLNYRLFLTASGEQDLKGCSISEKWQGFQWPVRCKGAFDDKPLSLCKLDSAGITRQVGDKAKEKLEQKAKQKLKTKLDDLLKGF